MRPLAPVHVVDIYKYPTRQPNNLTLLDPEQAKEFWYTIGDLHANPVKFLFFLILTGAVEMSEPNYDKFVAFYRSESEDIKAEIDAFNELIPTITVTPGANIRLIGDELADRGKNDYYMLRLISLLSRGQVNLEIIMSNHGVEFIFDREKIINHMKSKPAHAEADPDSEYSITLEQHLSVNENWILTREGSPSLSALKKAVMNGWLDNDHINDFFNDCIKHLKAFSWDEDEREWLYIFSHAPIGPLDIIMLALSIHAKWGGNIRMKIPGTEGADNPDAMPKKRLKDLMSFVNEHVKDSANRNELSLLLCMTHFNVEITDEKNWARVFAFYDILWNREQPVYAFKNQVRGVHGHARGCFLNAINLDTPLGKGLDAHKGELIYLKSKYRGPAFVPTPDSKRNIHEVDDCNTNLPRKKPKI